MSSFEFCEHSPPLWGSLGRLVEPSLGKEVDLKLCTRGGVLPLGCFPLWGREGVTLTTTDDFQKTQKLRISTEPNFLDLPIVPIPEISLNSGQGAGFAIPPEKSYPFL